MVINLSPKPVLVLDPMLLAYTNFLHYHVGSKEWSGILFYSVEGTIKDIPNMKFTASHMMLKDIGSSAYTEYSFDEDVLDFFDEFPETENMKMGHIHTHHNMKNFFSPTDMDELSDNSEHHNYYLSLIMSYDCQYSAKLAFRGSMAGSKIKDEEGNEVEMGNMGDKTILYVCDLDIRFALPASLVNRYNGVLTEYEEAKKKTYSTSQNYGSGYNYHRYGGGYNGYNNSYAQGELWRDDMFVDRSKTSVAPLNPKTPFSDKEKVAEAISNVLLCMDSRYDKPVQLETALYKFRQDVDEKDIEEYLEGAEQFMHTILEEVFHPTYLTDEDVQDFCGVALKYLDTLNLPDNKHISALKEMFEINSNIEEELK